MPPEVQAFAVLASLGLLTFILYLIRKGRLREEHALLWLMAGACILILSAWRGSLTTIARLLNIGYAPSLLFAVGMVFSLLILLAHTAALSNLTSHTRDLAQHISILEWQIQQLEEQLRHPKGVPGSTNGQSAKFLGPGNLSTSSRGTSGRRKGTERRGDFQ
jgi:hypothetical protein